MYLGVFEKGRDCARIMNNIDKIKEVVQYLYINDVIDVHQMFTACTFINRIEFGILNGQDPYFVEQQLKESDVGKHIKKYLTCIITNKWSESDLAEWDATSKAAYCMLRFDRLFDEVSTNINEYRPSNLAIYQGDYEEIPLI